MYKIILFVIQFGCETLGEVGLHWKYDLKCEYLDPRRMRMESEEASQWVLNYWNQGDYIWETGVSKTGRQNRRYVGIMMEYTYLMPKCTFKILVSVPIGENSVRCIGMDGRIVCICFDGVVIAAQCTATFLRSIVLHQI